MVLSSLWLLPRALLIVVTIAAAGAEAQEVDPAYRFHTLRTEHFAFHFHQEAAPVAASLAGIAEATWRRFEARPGPTPPAFTHVVLVDQSESANGFATTLPRNTIVLYAATPSAASLLNAEDWMRTLFVHEFTHIVHLDRAEGWARAARLVFGRAPWTFPNFMLPLWQIEGLATFEESVPAGPISPGRLHHGDFQALTREAARSGALEPIDRVGGGLTDWPGGLAPYAYGVSFHHWLAERFGPDSLERLSTETARSLPWLGTRAFRRIYGQNLGRLWDTYTADVVTSARASLTPAPDHVPQPAPRRVTSHGFQVAGPRYLPRSCDTCPREIAYALRTPHDRPGLHVVNADTLVTRRLTTRFFGQTMAVASDGTIYFDQQERRRNAGLYADLYTMADATGVVRRLTRDARLLDPDLSPDGRTIVAVQSSTPGQRNLVLVDLAKLETDGQAGAVVSLVSTVHTSFSAPRWSPDGRAVVVERQGPIGPSDIVVVDVATKRVDVIAADSSTRWTTPTWHPDGRTVIAAGAQGDTTSDLFAIDVESLRMQRITTHPGGATWPDVAPDGGRLVFVGYTAGGFDLHEVAYRPATPGSWPLLARARSPETTADTDTRSGADDALVSPYRPWGTMLPTSWTPLLTTSRQQIRAGAAVTGADVLGYHAWSASAVWPVIDREETARAGADADWTAVYVYGRWMPTAWAAVARTTSFYPVDADEAMPILPLTLVERTTEVGLQFPLRRLRFSQALQVSLVRASDTLTLADASQQRNRSGARLSWRYSSAQQPGYAISPERGLTLGVASEFVSPGLGATGRGGTVTADARVYAPGLSRHHVLALRAAGARTWGDSAVRRLFVLGGGDASPGAGTLSSDVARLMRGFAGDTFVGRQAATINADYRFPIARPQRGIGAWPLFLHSIHGAVIADAGHVWSGGFDRRSIKTSVGAELSANVVLGYGLPLTLSAGAARGHDGARTDSTGTTFYARVGYAF